MCKFEGEPSSSCMKNNAYIPSHRFSGIYIHRCVWKLGTIWVPKNANICQNKTEGRSNIGGQFLGLGDVFFFRKPEGSIIEAFFSKGLACSAINSWNNWEKNLAKNSKMVLQEQKTSTFFEKLGTDEFPGVAFLTFWVVVWIVKKTYLLLIREVENDPVPTREASVFLRASISNFEWLSLMKGLCSKKINPSWNCWHHNNFPCYVALSVVTCST